MANDKKANIYKRTKNNHRHQGIIHQHHLSRVLKNIFKVENTVQVTYPKLLNYNELNNVDKLQTREKYYLSSLNNRNSRATRNIKDTFLRFNKGK